MGTIGHHEVAHDGEHIFASKPHTILMSSVCRPLVLRVVALDRHSRFIPDAHSSGLAESEVTVKCEAILLVHIESGRVELDVFIDHYGKRIIIITKLIIKFNRSIIHSCQAVNRHLRIMEVESSTPVASTGCLVLGVSGRIQYDRVK